MKRQTRLLPHNVESTTRNIVNYLGKDVQINLSRIMFIYILIFFLIAETTGKEL